MAAAEILWDQFARHPPTAAAAARMLSHLRGDPVRAASALGRTGWNAYSFNVDYRTGRHLDSKNIPGSYSALLVFEAGAPFAGCFYLLPPYRVALDLRQGVVLYHRSGDAEVGVHANSGLHRQSSQCHRVALVLYQTEIKVATSEAEGEAGEGSPAEVGREQAPQPAEDAGTGGAATAAGECGSFDGRVGGEELAALPDYG